MWLYSVGLFIEIGCILIPNYFHVSLPHVSENPPCIEMLLRELFELLNSLEAVIAVHIEATICKFFEESCYVYIKRANYLEFGY